LEYQINGLYRSGSGFADQHHDAEQAQTFCQKAERFTVQKRRWLKPARMGERDLKNETFYSTQTLVCHEERSGMQNKMKGRGAMMIRSQ